MHDSVGIKPRDSYDFMANYVQALRQTPMEDGGETFLREWFTEESSRNPGFFHRLQYDAHNKIESIFWADARMILDYSAFRDAITFDTTYRTNNQYRPLGLFAGLNYHQKLTIFGACLMYEETTEGFKWVFNTFLECMKNKHSRTISTDQCPTIAAGIRSVMPNTFHALCIFHMNENAKENLKGKTTKDGIITDLNFLMKWVDTEDEFESRWHAMISKYYPDNLPHGHPWLVYIHKFRHQWSSVWVNNNFTAGMRSSQLSESLNSNLRPLLNTKKNLHQFFTHFNRLLESKRSDEEQLDFNVGDNLPIARYRTCPLVCQAAKVYTKTIFEFFQNEFAMSLAYEPSSSHILDNERLKVFFWHHFDNDKKIWIDERRVEVDIASWKYRCPCRLFEYSGWLCCHILRTMEALKLLGYIQARTIPAFYLIDRWTRSFKIGLNYQIDLSPSSDPDTQVGRYYQLYSAFVPVALEACVNPNFLGITIKMVEDIESYIRQTILNRQEASHEIPPRSVAGNNDGEARRQEQSRPGELKERNNPNKSTKRLKSNG